MTDTQTTAPTATAQPRGVSLYLRQWLHAQQKAKELTDRTGKKVSVSEYIQGLIDADMKKPKRDSKPQ